MLLPNRGQEVMYEFADEAARVVNPSDELWNHLKPGVNVDSTHTLHQSLVDILQVAIVKPESQQSVQRIRVCTSSFGLIYTVPLILENGRFY